MSHSLHASRNWNDCMSHSLHAGTGMTQSPHACRTGTIACLTYYMQELERLTLHTDAELCMPHSPHAQELEHLHASLSTCQQELERLHVSLPTCRNWNDSISTCMQNWNNCMSHFLHAGTGTTHSPHGCRTVHASLPTCTGTGTLACLTLHMHAELEQLHVSLLTCRNWNDCMPHSPPACTGTIASLTPQMQ